MKLFESRYQVHENRHGYIVAIPHPLDPKAWLEICFCNVKAGAEHIAQVLEDSPVAGPWDYVTENKQ